MAFFDFLFGSGQGGGTSPPPAQAVIPAKKPTSILESLSIIPATTATYKAPPPKDNGLLSLTVGKQQPINPIIKSIIPSAEQEYDKFAEENAKKEYEKQTGLKVLQGNLLPPAPKKAGIVSKLTSDVVKGIGTGFMDIFGTRGEPSGGGDVTDMAHAMIKAGKMDDAEKLLKSPQMQQSIEDAQQKELLNPITGLIDPVKESDQAYPPGPVEGFARDAVGGFASLVPAMAVGAVGGAALSATGLPAVLGLSAGVERAGANALRPLLAKLGAKAGYRMIGAEAGEVAGGLIGFNHLYTGLRSQTIDELKRNEIEDIENLPLNLIIGGGLHLGIKSVGKVAKAFTSFANDLRAVGVDAAPARISSFIAGKEKDPAMQRVWDTMPNDQRAIMMQSFIGENRMMALKPEERATTGMPENRLAGKTGPVNDPKYEQMKRDLESAQSEVANREIAHEELSMAPNGESRDYSKYIQRSTGRLPEQTTSPGDNTSGKFGTGKDKRTRLEVEGDTIAAGLGFEDYETMRDHQDLITENKTKLREAKLTAANLKVEMKEYAKNAPPPETVPAGQEKLRGLLNTLQNSKNISDELKAKLKKVDPQTYKVKPNEEAFSLAKEIIKEDPVEARNIIMSEMPPDEMKGAIGDELIRHYDDLATKAKTAAERDSNYAQAVEIAETMDEQRRKAGRFIQTAAAWNQLSPDAMHYSITRDVKKAGVELSKDQMVDLRRLTKEMQDIADATEKAKKMDEIVDVVAKNIKPTWGEWTRAYLYQNMLLGKAIVRNAYQNFFNTYVSRPADILSMDVYDMFRSMLTGKERTHYLSDLPKYYRDSVASIPNAVKAYGDVIAGRTPMTHADLQISPQTIVNAAKQSKMPKILTIAQRHMEAGDRMFSVLIGQGEKARLMRNGMSEGLATEEAIKVSTEYLARNKLDPSDMSRPTFSRALDEVGKNIMNLRNKKVIGPVVRFFVPFVSTPINVAKLSLERTPMGLIGGSHSDLQIARALMGSLVTAAAGVVAANGQTTWIAPADAKQRQLWYDAGNKPYSVKIAGKSVPIVYFGPFALPIALAAAVWYYQVDEKEALTDSQMIKLAKMVGGIANFLSQQTSTQGYTNFYKAISGDADYSTAGSMGFTASQVIPLSALTRDVNKIIDHVYRKGSLLQSAPLQSIIGQSSKLPAIENSKGKPTLREPINVALPYDIGTINEKAEREYQKYAKQRQGSYQQSKIKDAMKDRYLTPAQRKAKVQQLKSGGGIFSGVPILEDLFSPADESK